MESPYTQHLHTNYVPPENDINVIRTLLLSREAQIHRYDEEISRLQLILENLNSERKVIQDDCDAHRALISPARRLPLDILSEIFIRCLPHDRNAVMDITEAPLLLGHICGSWRSIASNIPRLWSSLHIPLSEKTFAGDESETRTCKRPSAARLGGRDDFRITMVSGWLKRAGACDLALSLRANPSKTSDTASSLSQWMQLLSSTSMQWRSLDLLATDTSDPHSQIFCQATQPWNYLDPEKDLPRLESLKLEFRMSCFGDRSTMSWNNCTLLRAPRLRELAIASVDDPSSLSVQWNQLTFLSLNVHDIGFFSSGLSYTHVLRILKQCHQLIKLKVYMHGLSIGDSRDPDMVINLPHLKHIFVHMPLRSTNTHKFFSSINVPSLTFFDFHTTAGNYYEDRPNVLTHADIKQCLSTVQNFHLDLRTWHHLSHSDFIDILGSMPALVELEITRVYPTGVRYLSRIESSHPLDPLTPPEDGDIPETTRPDHSCPFLRSFKWKMNVAFSDSELVKFIRRKRFSPRSQARLQEVHVVFDRPQQLDVQSELSDLIEEGLVLNLSYTTQEPKPTAWDGLSRADNF